METDPTLLQSIILPSVEDISKLTPPRYPRQEKQRTLSVGYSLNSNANFYDIPATDSFNDILERYLPPQERPQRNISDDKIKGPDIMVMNNMWRAVAKYTRQQIVQSEPTKIDHILKLWHMRLLALIKLNLCQLAAAELEKLGDLDRSELIDPHTQESMVPYALWILWARLPSYLKQVSVTLERLTMLAVKCMKLKKKNDARREIWAHREVQTYLVLATHLICIKDYTTAAKVMESILHQVPDQVDILSGLGRLYLQMGDMDKANQIFHHLESVVGEKEHVKETVGINQSFLSMAQGDWLSARDRLQKIYDSNKENLLVMSNLAVCEVYLGNLLKAIELLEALTRENPSSAGTCETAITNICTLYELRYEDATSKKVEIMKQVSRWAGDSFQQDCIKLK